MSFTDAEEEHLIKLVADNPAIYNADHPEHRNVHMKEYIWNIIAKELKRNCEDCKKKWKLIRDGYHRYKKSLKKPPSTAALKKSKNERHKLLVFLDNVPHKSGNYYDNKIEALVKKGVTVEVENNSNTDEGKSEHQDEVCEHSTSQDESIRKTESDDDDDDGDDDDDEFLEVVKEKQQFKRRRQHKHVQPCRVDVKRPKIYKTVVKQKEDDVELFCRHIAEVLKQLPPVLKAEAKKQLGSLVSDYEIMAARDRAMSPT